MKKSLKKEIQEWNKISHLFPQDIPLKVNLDTSTEEGRNYRKYVLGRENEKSHLDNLRAKYRESGDKRYAVQINNFTGDADNIPEDDK